MERDPSFFSSINGRDVFLAVEALLLASCDYDGDRQRKEQCNDRVRLAFEADSRSQTMAECLARYQ